MQQEPAPAPAPRALERTPPRFHVLTKPSGSTCNLDCTYCFFLSKDALYPDEKHRMSEETLEAYIRQLLESHRSPNVTVAWQGGEPTLLGLEFYERSIDYVQQYRRPGQKIEYTFQTNGVLLDDRWCAFFRKHGFLVGLSVDGPRAIHDVYRVSRGGQGTFDRVMRGWSFLRKHGVECNVLCTVNAANQAHGREVYRFFRDEMKAQWLQFIPIVERATAETLATANRGWSEQPGEKRLLYTQAGTLVTERSVDGEQYGRFLIDIFEDWVRRDVGRMYVQMFDVTLEAAFGSYQLCIHAPTCGVGPALEYNGDLYSCDHYVEPDYLLGNIHTTPMLELVSSDAQRKFGGDKRDLLTRQCRECDVLKFCNGGCPKDRFAVSEHGEPRQNFLCAGFKRFFGHFRPALDEMARLIKAGEAPSEVMAWMAAADVRRGPQAPCSCGSGRMLVDCHGDDRQAPEGASEPSR